MYFLSFRFVIFFGGLWHLITNCGLDHNMQLKEYQLRFYPRRRHLATARRIFPWICMVLACAVGPEVSFLRW